MAFEPQLDSIRSAIELVGDYRCYREIRQDKDACRTKRAWFPWRTTVPTHTTVVADALDALVFRVGIEASHLAEPRYSSRGPLRGL